MSRFLTAPAALPLALAFASLWAAAPAAAQEQTTANGEKYNMVIVYGDQPCEASSDPEVITVCARVSDQYRIPEPLRGVDSPQSQSWTNRVDAYETVGAFGTLSCSPVGPGGSLGCTQKLIDQAYAERKNGSDVKFGELIAAERDKRLSTIDADAAAQQKRVEEAEAAYMAQRKRNEAQQDAAQAGAPAAQTP